jgi:hypothetical protein
MAARRRWRSGRCGRETRPPAPRPASSPPRASYADERAGYAPPPSCASSTSASARRTASSRRSPSLLVPPPLRALHAQPPPRVARPMCLSFASEERECVYLHLLSPRKELCLPFCIICWRRKWRGTVAHGRQKGFCLPLLESV